MKQKKILIITYYWPPAGGPGVQRWLKFAKYLPDFGYKPILTENKKFKGYFIPIEQKVCIDEDKNNIFTKKIKKLKNFFDNDK